MTGINRVLMLASMAALALPAAAAQSIAGFGQRVQDSIGDETGNLSAGGAQPPRYPGYGKRMGVKQAKRRAAKRRNVLRSKGHFRKAVR